MSVVFRVDSGPDIGRGHLYRCMALAQRFQTEKQDIHFLVASLLEEDVALLKAHGFYLHRILAANSEKADAFQSQRAIEDINSCRLLVVDSYKLGYEWESAIHDTGLPLLVLDDLVNRRHNCDYLINACLDGDAPNPYTNLIPERTRTWFDLEHLLLRAEFVPVGQIRRAPDGPKKVAVMLGSSTSPQSIDEAVKGALSATRDPDEIRVFQPQMTSTNATSTCRHRRVFLHPFTSNLNEELSQVDLCVGALGVSAWERCMSGLPSVAAIAADNQIMNARRLTSFRASMVVGDMKTVTAEDWRRAIAQALVEPEYSAMSAAAVKLQSRIGSGVPALVREVLGV